METNKTKLSWESGSTHHVPISLKAKELGPTWPKILARNSLKGVTKTTDLELRKAQLRNTVKC